MFAVTFWQGARRGAEIAADAARASALVLELEAEGWEAATHEVDEAAWDAAGAAEADGDAELEARYPH